MRVLIYCLLGAICFTSCTRRNLTYFSNLPIQGIYQDSVNNATEPKIQPDDLLNITVTSLSPESNMLFNRGVVMPTTTTAYGAMDNPQNVYREGYIVDKKGFIDFPVLGKTRLAGLTKTQAKDTLTKALLLYLKEPIVYIRFLNYKITVVGEVNRPATFTIPSERISVLEALGMAGDMTIFGKRENVLIIREEQGARTATRLNLNDKSVLNSPYFYLQQNDVVYVEPDRMKQVQASTNTRTISIIASVTTLLIVVATRVL
ncbi:polysaccharide export outer membrane protein [Catalinimonas alkaloidigena]|uniref:Polysaccharide export outer membrane protein n=1 Tax=Catalinimonas alkaloidigena TaxID=1075417 RepID=A0A1G9J498_9BACT|nr:polysaccharide biosynthesis/export family protein [Catalinimonas alkaloidigena]SDL32142.1 polysaccharide export outer membrane protein [Catalinimonas alkaloidigena]